MSQSETPLIEARDVVVRRGECPVVDRASLGIRRGEIVVLVGPNGAGKTTLMRALAGVQRIDAGEVLIGGVRLSGIGPERRARAIGYLPQTRDVHWPLAVSEIVTLGQPGERLLGRTTGVPDEARQVMADFDVTHLAARPVTELSGGELARVLLARAVLQGGDVLIADEPAAGLDLKHRLGLMSALRARIEARGSAALVSVHDLALAVRHADRIVVMHRGRIVACGPAATTLTPDVLKSVWDVDGEVRVIDGVAVLIARAAG